MKSQETYENLVEQESVRERLKQNIVRIPIIGEFAFEMIYEYRMRKKEKEHAALSQQQVIDELKEIYMKVMGRNLNLQNPKMYTEKMQWRKLYGSTPEMGYLTDKYSVREWVKNRIGAEYLIPLLGVYDNAKDIQFKNLPKSFVMKTNNGSGTNIIVKDKSKIIKSLVRRRLNFWLKTRFSMVTYFEKHYDYISPKIIIEQYMHDTKTDDIRDYKFICFDGVPHFVWVDCDRYSKHCRKVFDLDWNLQNWNQMNYKDRDILIEKPENFDEMIWIVKELSKGFDHVRVDLYDINGKVYFGEMTFTNGGGLEKIEPQEMDEYLGRLWNLKGMDVV